MGLTYRKCEIADLDLLARIARDTFHEAFARDNKPENIEAYLNQSFSKIHVEQELKEPGSEFYFAYDGEELIGYLKVNLAGSQTDVNEEGTIELERIYVLSQFQSKGYGRQMMDKALGIARELRLNYLWLGVWEKNLGAIRFYERCGFEKFAEHSFFMGDEEQTDHLMKLIL